MRLNNILIWAAIVALGVLAGGTFYYQDRRPPSEIPPLFRGVTVGNEYFATGTSPIGANTTVVDYSIREGWGSLGSVVVTYAGDAHYQLLDASSTVMTIDGFSTSSQILADIPASLAVGTYIFDVQYTDGLFLDVIDGTLGTSTITFR